MFKGMNGKDTDLNKTLHSVHQYVSSSEWSWAKT